MAAIGTISYMKIFVELEKEDIVLQFLDSLKSKIYSPFNKITYVGNMYLSLKSGKIEDAESSILEIEELIEELSWDIVQFYTLDGRGQISELKGDFEQAIKYYNQVMNLYPNNEKIQFQIAQCYRKLSKPGEAKKIIEKLLSIHQFWPKLHYELSLIYNEMGKKKKALEEVKIVLGLWENADSSYDLVINAKSLLSDLENE